MIEATGLLGELDVVWFLVRLSYLRLFCRLAGGGFVCDLRVSGTQDIDMLELPQVSGEEETPAAHVSNNSQDVAADGRGLPFPRPADVADGAGRSQIT